MGGQIVRMVVMVNAYRISEIIWLKKQLWGVSGIQTIIARVMTYIFMLRSILFFLFPAVKR